MGDVSEFVWGVIASTAGTTVLLGIATFLFRTKISHWLSKDLEAQKAQHQRDLESYKVTLIAETERSRAAQALKTAGALKIVEKKVAAIDRLHNAMVGFAVNPLALAQMEAFEDRHLEVAKLPLAQAEYRIALEGACTFLGADDIRILTDYATSVAEVCFAISMTGDALTPEEIKIYSDKVVPISRAADDVIKREINAILSMG